jgi:hypothetical protein
MKARLVVALALLLLAMPARAAEDPVKCAPQNKLCEYLANFIRGDLYGDGVVRRWEETSPLRYTTFGMSAEQAQIFADLLQGLAKRAGLEALPVEPGRVRDLNIIAANVENDDVRKNIEQIVGFAGKGHSAAQIAQFANNNTALIVYQARYYNRNAAISAQGRMKNCALLLRLNSLAAKPELVGFVMARQIYQCLTGAPRSDVVLSIMNTQVPASLLSPPYAKLSPIDSAVLRILYEPGDSLFGVKRQELIDRFEARLRQEGFRDDGTKP